MVAMAKLLQPTHVHSEPFPSPGPRGLPVARWSKWEAWAADQIVLQSRAQSLGVSWASTWQEDSGQNLSIPGTPPTPGSPLRVRELKRTQTSQASVSIPLGIVEKCFYRISWRETGGHQAMGKLELKVMGEGGRKL